MSRSSSNSSSLEEASHTTERSPRRHQYEPSNPSQLRESTKPPSSPTSPKAMDSDLRSLDRLPPGEEDYFDHAGAEVGQAGTLESEAGQWPRQRRGVQYPSVPSSPSGNGGKYPGDIGEAAGERGDNVHGIFGDTFADGVMGSKTGRSTTSWLADRHGVRHSRLIYIDYYFPFLKWIRQYRWSHLSGDLIAALTMASFYIPMSLSYASNLGHVPPINGMYSFALNPLVYAFFGTCPQMVVGPEAPGSLLTGNVVRDSIRKGHARDDDGFLHAQIAGVVTGVAGAILFVAGGARLGFLDNVLSKPFLRGFISSIGLVILIDQAIPELGLAALAGQNPDIEHGSPLTKLILILQNIKNSHGLTAAVSFGSFAVIMVCREVKKRLQPRFPRIVFIPDRFVVVALCTLFSWRYDWTSKGVAILGNAKSPNTHLFQAHFPFDFSNIKHLESALSTSFLIALLGFFESSVAAKAIGTGPSDGIQNIALSANRELIALGTANVIGGVFMALPAFGGYGRSKINASAGGKTPMSSIFLSLITVLCVLFMLPVFYYIPKGVLCAMISVVAYSLVEEAPHDLKFFWRIRGWTELFLVFLVFAATMFYSLTLGIACGIGFSLLRVVKHSTRPRIQILGRVQGKSDEFENAEADPERLEFIEGCLIVKIPEPLTFANTGDLRSRLRRLEDYGTASAHPALPRVRHADNNKNIIFDVHGVTDLDGAGAQVLSEILEGYKTKGIRIFFCRVPRKESKVWRLLVSSGIVQICGGEMHFVKSVQEALSLTEEEETEGLAREP
ncbi:MAG: hypothetical protein M1828_000557 [Chrysothrix sp. TS-e1954]|nr:MAG: hypothetical protein M1828_000557 [Chrysothrix sp. TS-e1954]